MKTIFAMIMIVIFCAVVIVAVSGIFGLPLPWDPKPLTTSTSPANSSKAKSTPPAGWGRMPWKMDTGSELLNPGKDKKAAK